MHGGTFVDLCIGNLARIDVFGGKLILKEHHIGSGRVERLNTVSRFLRRQQKDNFKHRFSAVLIHGEVLVKNRQQPPQFAVHAAAGLRMPQKLL